MCLHEKVPEDYPIIVVLLLIFGAMFMNPKTLHAKSVLEAMASGSQFVVSFEDVKSFVVNKLPYPPFSPPWNLHSASSWVFFVSHYLKTIRKVSCLVALSSSTCSSSGTSRTFIHSNLPSDDSKNIY